MATNENNNFVWWKHIAAIWGTLMESAKYAHEHMG